MSADKMSSDKERERLEKIRLSLQHDIQSIEKKSKKLHERQLLLDKLAGRLRAQEMLIEEKIHKIIKEESPFVELVALKTVGLDKGTRLLFLN